MSRRKGRTPRGAVTRAATVGCAGCGADLCLSFLLGYAYGTVYGGWGFGCTGWDVCELKIRRPTPKKRVTFHLRVSV
jgi:hypothetical protein